MTTPKSARRATSRREVIVALSVDATQGEPPAEVRLFVWGENRTMNGDFVLDRAGAEEALQRFADYGNALTWDYEHDTFNPMATGDRPSAGWTEQGGLSIRDDGLWQSVAWTERAKTLIRAREYRYFSPTFIFEEETRRITEILPTALVNYPATIGMTPLMSGASTAVKKGRTLKMQIDFPSLAAAMDAAQAAVTAKFGDGVTVVDINEAGIVFTMNGKTWTTAYTVENGAVTLTGELTEVVAEQPADAPPADAPAGDAPAAMQGAQLRTQLGATQLGQLAAQVAKLTRELESRDRAALIAEGKSAHKLTPAMVKWAEAQPLATLRSFLAAAPVIAPLAAGDTREPEAKAELGRKYEDYSNNERAELARTNPKMFAELRADAQSRGVFIKKTR